MNRTTLLSLSLLAVFILAACIPNTSAPPPTVTVAAPEPTPSEEVSAAPMADTPTATDAPVEQPVAVATSRGDQLEATNPATVNIASGQPQLIEFFAFW